MKILNAKFKNFRLLRDLELDFSVDPEKKLTVIRAANESGKTTILHGLQWALYGEAALPGKNDFFRIYPIDWDESEGNQVNITAMVEFETTTHRQVGGEVRETRRHYRLVRSASENINKQVRSGSTVKLYELNDKGMKTVDAPEAIINDELPPELREVFFTDGDRALSFIEADVAISTKRERVQRAIRSLLGLNVIEEAIKHVQKSSQEINRKAKKIGSDSELNNIASCLEEIENTIEAKNIELKDAKQQFRAFDESLNDIDREIADVLKKGDKEKLQKDLEQTKREINELEEQLIGACKKHASLFRNRSIATELLSPILDHAFEKLDVLHDQRKIPNATLPVLYDRLSVELCICGESLKLGNPESEKRRKCINSLIEDSQRADEIQKILTDLYFGAKQLQDKSGTDSKTWIEEYGEVFKQRDGIQVLRDEAGRRYRALELQLDLLPDTDIQGLREMQRQQKAQRDHYLSQKSTLETQITEERRVLETLVSKRDSLLKDQKKGSRILAESEVIQDVTKVLSSTYEIITIDELQKVSELMNELFLVMIGADPEQGAIIQYAEISSDFDIIVYGPNNRLLNPDRDLNGASRRALTLAFILALTKVSEVEAPNVIDTPLGMTSGYVKRSILRTAIKESAQLILFLTHDEIAGCEEIIDEAAGVVFTLTNPAHYPKMLVNNPNIKERMVLRCECDHRSECNLCMRHSDAQVTSEIAL